MPWYGFVILIILIITLGLFNGYILEKLLR